MKIGVFDSGIGGEAVAARLRELLPDATVITANDRAHVPYGDHSSEDIHRLTKAAIQPLLQQSCDAIVIACNTATTAAIGSLRTAYPTQPFIGIEPMVKPAVAITKSKVIAVLATPATLKSERYAALKETWAQGVTVIEPNCASWTPNIESGTAENIPVETVVDGLLQQGVDTIVLGCTHYHWLKRRIEAAAGPSVTVLEPSDAIASQIDTILAV